MQRWDNPYLMELPFFSQSVARGGEVFCFLVDAEGILSSDFLFFARASWACSSRKLCDVVLAGIALSSGASSLVTVVGDGALDGGLGSMGATFSVLGGGPNLMMSWGRGGSGAEAEASLGDAISVSVQDVVSVAIKWPNALPPSVPVGADPVCVAWIGGDKHVKLTGTGTEVCNCHV